MKNLFLLRTCLHFHQDDHDNNNNSNITIIIIKEKRFCVDEMRKKSAQMKMKTIQQYEKVAFLFFSTITSVEISIDRWLNHTKNSEMHRFENQITCWNEIKWKQHFTSFFTSRKKNHRRAMLDFFLSFLLRRRSWDRRNTREKLDSSWFWKAKSDWHNTQLVHKKRNQIAHNIYLILIVDDVAVLTMISINSKWNEMKSNNDQMRKESNWIFDVPERISHLRDCFQERKKEKKHFHIAFSMRRILRREKKNTGSFHLIKKESNEPIEKSHLNWKLKRPNQ